MADFQALFSQLQFLSVLEREIWGGAGLHVQTKILRSPLPVPEREIIRVQSNFQLLCQAFFQRLHDPSDPGNVIKMGVGKPDRLNTPAFLPRCLKDVVPLSRRINHGCFPGDRIRNQIGIGCHWSQDKALNI
jgi:hypothetical protein